mgnify:FL=1|jgi:hypothetical protein
MNEKQQAYHDRLPERYRKLYRKALAGQRAPAIRVKCLDCMCWQSGEVHRCDQTQCPLWSFRVGTRSAQRRTKQTVSGASIDKESR